MEAEAVRLLSGWPTAAALSAEFQALEAGAAGTWFLWEGPEAIVIGKNQVLWAEVDAGATSALGIPTHRRRSGGGAVYHGPGNLNFGRIFRSNAPLDFACLLAPVLALFAGLGVATEVRNQTDIFLRDGNKISGNAVARRRDCWLHHGTLLVDASLDRLRATLRTSHGIAHRGIRSRPSPVENLAGRLPGLTPAAVATAWAAALGHPHPVPEPAPTPAEADPGPAWIVGQGPSYRVTGHWNHLATEIEVREGRIASAALTSGDATPLAQFLASLPCRWHLPDRLAPDFPLPPKAFFPLLFPA